MKKFSILLPALIALVIVAVGCTNDGNAGSNGESTGQDTAATSDTAQPRYDDNKPPQTSSEF